MEEIIKYQEAAKLLTTLELSKMKEAELVFSEMNTKFGVSLVDLEQIKITLDEVYNVKNAGSFQTTIEQNYAQLNSYKLQIEYMLENIKRSIENYEVKVS
jgi:hypothetical protein